MNSCDMLALMALLMVVGQVCAVLDNIEEFFHKAACAARIGEGVVDVVRIRSMMTAWKIDYYFAVFPRASSISIRSVHLVLVILSSCFFMPQHHTYKYNIMLASTDYYFKSTKFLQIVLHGTTHHAATNL